MNLQTSLTALEGVLDVVCGIPGAVSTEAETPFIFNPAGVDGAVLPDGSINQGEQATLDYSIISIVGQGTDELRKGYDPDTLILGDTYEPNPLDPDERLGAVIESRHGPRLITVQIKCECFDPRWGGAFRFLERARTRLALPTINTLLETAGIALARIGDTSAHHYTDENGRTVSVALFEATFNAADQADDDPITTIEIVEKPELEP